MEVKRLYDISWQVPEAIYRADKALSYSTLAKFSREGFNKLDFLFDKTETPSLTFGRAVDALITGGQEEFDKEFMVADIPSIPDSIITVVRDLFREFNGTHVTLSSIPDIEVIHRAASFNYQPNWRPETRAKVIKEKGGEYYNLMYVAKDRKILDMQTKEQIDATVDSLKNSENTKFYFSPNNVFNNRYIREYQLKFKATLNDIDYKCMADLIILDTENKIAYPFDLKTSSKPEWDFYKSFIEWKYDIQARLYWRIIRDNMDRDPYFKDFALADFTFIVINKYTLTPLTWRFSETTAKGTLFYGKDSQIELEDPEEIGKTLSYYLSSRPKVPCGINDSGNNSIGEWLNTIN